MQLHRHTNYLIKLNPNLSNNRASCHEIAYHHGTLITAIIFLFVLHLMMPQVAVAE